MESDLRLWTRLHCLAFDDVVREVCTLGSGGGAEAMDDARLVAGHFLRLLSGVGTPPGDPVAGRRLERLLRGSLFVRFGQRVLYWMDRLGEVEGEYRWRLGVLRGRPTAEDLRPFVDRGEA